MATTVRQLDLAALEKALEGLRVARRRGRIAELDQRVAGWGMLPAQIAATLLDRRISTIYQAHKRGKLRLVQIEGYWFVHKDELIAFALRPVQVGRPRKERTDAH